MATSTAPPPMAAPAVPPRCSTPVGAAPSAGPACASSVTCSCRRWGDRPRRPRQPSLPGIWPRARLQWQARPAAPVRAQGENDMLRDPKVIEHLNTQLTNELTAINQYFLHARTLRHWGVTKLGEHEYAESIGEMKDADELINRILFLGGLPNVQRLNPIGVGENVEQV